MKFDTEGNAIIGDVVVSNGTYVIPSTEYTSTGNWILSIGEELTKILLEQIFYNDVRSLSLTHLLIDSVIGSELKNFNVSKSVGDSITLSDVYTGIRAILKTFTDSLLATDLSSFVVSKRIAEVVTNKDSVFKEYTKHFVDSLLLSDLTQTAILYLKTVIELIVISDEVQTPKILLLILVEASSLIEGLSRSVTKFITESIEYSDTFIRWLQQAVIRFYKSTLSRAVGGDKLSRAVNMLTKSIRGRLL